MPFYLISYDLRKVRDYEPVYALLRSWKAARVLESVWLVELVGPAETVRNLLSAKMDANDGVFVIQLYPNSQWTTKNVQAAGAAWLQKHAT